VAFQGRVAAVDRTTGRVLWNRDISSYTGLTAHDGRVFVTHSGGAVYALDDATGKSYWRQGGLLNRQLSAPLSLGSHAAVADVEGYVHFLSREDGAFSERIQVSGGAAMPQLVDLGNATILVQTRGGSLAAIALK
jgi:outer membrane protein assembly factor BamB